MNNNVTVLIGRILLSVIFIMAGASKFGAIAGTAGYIASKGLPAATLIAWATAIFEVVAGLAILVGFNTRIAAYALALFCVLAAVIFHFDPADQMQMQAFMKNMAIAGGFLVLAVHGPGNLSLDARRNTA